MAGDPARSMRSGGDHAEIYTFIERHSTAALFRQRTIGQAWSAQDGPAGGPEGRARGTIRPGGPEDTARSLPAGPGGPGGPGGAWRAVAAGCVVAAGAPERRAAGGWVALFGQGVAPRSPTPPASSPGDGWVGGWGSRFLSKGMPGMAPPSRCCRGAG